MPKPFPTLAKLIQLMEKKHQAAIRLIMKMYHYEFYTAPGGLNKHQNWRGGYADHVHETMSIAHLIYGQMKKYRPIPFSLSSALFVLFFHDLEKMFYYAVDHKERPYKIRVAKDKNRCETLAIMRRLKIQVTPKEQNALRYIHGENKDYHPSKRIMNELAAFVHCCDTLSARVWYDYPHSRVLDTTNR